MPREKAGDRNERTPEEDEELFVRGLRERGEAVHEGDELPPGATHEIVEGGEDAPRKVKRRRFSAC